MFVRRPICINLETLRSCDDVWFETELVKKIAFAFTV